VRDRVPLELTFDPEGDLLAAARQCELDVFYDVYGNTPEEWDIEYGPYQSNSHFIVASEPGGDVLAVSRLIFPGSPGHKTLNDAAREPWLVDGYRSAAAVSVGRDDTIDVATTAVRRGLRGLGHLLAASLHHGLILATRANNLPNCVMIIDERARRTLHMLGLVFHPLPGTEPASYLGSKSSQPLWGHMPTILDVQRGLNADAHRLVAQAIGLDGIAIPPQSAFAAKDPSAAKATPVARPIDARPVPIAV
jgi:hypothetical protein